MPSDDLLQTQVDDHFDESYMVCMLVIFYTRDGRWTESTTKRKENEMEYVNKCILKNQLRGVNHVLSYRLIKE